MAKRRRVSITPTAYRWFRDTQAAEAYGSKSAAAFQRLAVWDVRRIDVNGGNDQFMGPCVRVSEYEGHWVITVTLEKILHEIACETDSKARAEHLAAVLRKWLKRTEKAIAHMDE